MPMILLANIKFDGSVNSNEWSDGEKYELLYETSPSYNSEAEHRTISYVKNDQFFLYVGFQVYGNKDYIRAQIRSRDGIFYTNDHVVFGIDTYGDGRYYVGFGANPLGSILDYKEGSRGEAERSYNVEFEAKSQLTEYGYDVELKIPFSSLNYPDKEINKWKVLFERKLYNKGVESRYSSNKVIAGAGCNICQSQFFYLPGKVSQKSKKRLIPTVTANSNTYRDSNNNLKTDNTNLEFSLNGIYEISKNNFEFTINPDFSQVEADETQIDVNSTTALRYPERRIFFNEGADFLNTDSSAVYTRAINSPNYALKIYNRGDKHSYYFLDAEDEITPLIVPGDQRSYSATLGKSHANIFSYRYNIDNGQYISFLSTNRSYEEGGNGFLYLSRGLFLLDEKYALRFELAESQTEEPISDLITTDDTSEDHNYKLDGEKFDGYSGMLAISRSTENWFTNLWIGTKSPNFRTDLGFTTENNWKANNLRHEYRFRSNGLIRSGEIGISAKLIDNYDNVLLQQEYELNGEINLSNQFEFRGGFKNNKKLFFEGNSFSNLTNINFSTTYSPSGNFYIRAGINDGKSIARRIAKPVVGDSFNYNISSRYQFTDEFNVRIQYRYQELVDPITKDDYFAGYISSIRGTYQFDSNSRLRVVHEYNDFNNDSYTQALFQWQPDSATIFYIGGTFNQKDIEGTWQQEGSQIYMKLQYLFNFD